MKTEKINYLWKLDDPEWVAERKETWRFLQINKYRKASKDELFKYREYFVGGVYERYIPANILYLLTPIVSQEDSDSVFNSSMFESSERKRILELYIPFGTTNIGCDWGRQQVRNFIEHRLGGLKSDVRLDGVVCHTLLEFVASYIEFTVQLLQGKLDYSFVIDSQDQFLYCLDKVDLNVVAEKFNHTAGFNDLFEQLFKLCEQCLRKGSMSALAMKHFQFLLDNRNFILEKGLAA